MQDLEQYLEEVKFSNQLKKLEKKLKNKKIIIYGAGTLFQLIANTCDLSKLNIIGICDRKFKLIDEQNDVLGYKVIIREKLEEYKPDYILVSAYEYLPVIRSLENNYFENVNVKILPLVQYPITKTIAELLF